MVLVEGVNKRGPGPVVLKFPYVSPGLLYELVQHVPGVLRDHLHV